MGDARLVGAGRTPLLRLLLLQKHVLHQLGVQPKVTTAAPKDQLHVHLPTWPVATVQKECIGPLLEQGRPPLEQRRQLVVGVGHRGAVVPLVLLSRLPLALGRWLVVELPQPPFILLELPRLGLPLLLLDGEEGHRMAAAHGPLIAPPVLLARPLPLRHPAPVGTSSNLVVFVAVLWPLVIGQVAALHLDRGEEHPPDELQLRTVFGVPDPDESMPYPRPLLPDPPLLTPVPPLVLVALETGEPAVFLLAQPLREAHPVLVPTDGVHQLVVASLVITLGAHRLPPKRFHRLQPYVTESRPLALVVPRFPILTLGTQHFLLRVPHPPPVPLLLAAHLLIDTMRVAALLLLGPLVLAGLPRTLVPPRLGDPVFVVLLLAPGLAVVLHTLDAQLVRVRELPRVLPLSSPLLPQRHLVRPWVLRLAVAGAEHQELSRHLVEAVPLLRRERRQQPRVLFRVHKVALLLLLAGVLPPVLRHLHESTAALSRYKVPFVPDFAHLARARLQWFLLRVATMSPSLRTRE